VVRYANQGENSAREVSSVSNNISKDSHTNGCREYKLIPSHDLLVSYYYFISPIWNYHLSFESIDFLTDVGYNSKQRVSENPTVSKKWSRLHCFYSTIISHFGRMRNALPIRGKKNFSLKKTFCQRQTGKHEYDVKFLRLFWYSVLVWNNQIRY